MSVCNVLACCTCFRGVYVYVYLGHMCACMHVDTHVGTMIQAHAYMHTYMHGWMLIHT